MINMEKKILKIKPYESLSLTIGGLTSFAHRYYSTRFPKNYFKKSYISDSLNSLNYRKKVFQSMEMPYLAIQPQFELGGTFMGDLPMWTNTNYVFPKNNKNFANILHDEERGIKVYVIPNRIKVNFSTAIKVQTQLEAINLLQYISSEVDPGGFYYMNGIQFQTEFPKSIIKVLFNVLNLDESNPADVTYVKNYLKKFSPNTIEETVNLQTGNKSYMYNYFANILFSFQDEPTYEKITKGKLIDAAVVKENFSCEVWAPSMYVVELTKYDYTVTQPSVDLIGVDSSTFKFNLAIETDFVPTTLNERTLLVRGNYITDMNVEIDELDMKPILDHELLYILETLIENKKDITELIDVKVYGVTELLSSMYTVDYTKLKLFTNQPEANMNYRIFIYFDLLKMGEITKNIKENDGTLIVKDLSW